MVTVHWYELTFDGEYAVNNGDSIVIYDADYNEIQRITNLTYRDAAHVSIEGGEWTQAEEIPTETDRLRADIDYLDMQAESLEASDEANRADIDYCLMMLDDGATDEQLDDTTTEETGTTVTDEPTTDSTTDDGDTTDEQLG